jgi:hypothetical protein
MVCAALVGLMVLVLALVSFPLLGGLVSQSTTNQVYGPGPISTFPASWDDPCELPVHGNMTTANTIQYSNDPAAANINLSETYSRIVNSSAFQALAAGRTWVTIAWAIVQATGPGPDAGNSVAGTFVFVSGGHPDGSAEVDYILETGNVVVTYTGPLVSSCPPTVNESSSAASSG